MGDMAKFPGLMRFARRKYIVRAFVPQHLRAIIGKNEIWKTTRTAEIRAAKKLYPIIRAQLDTDHSGNRRCVDHSSTRLVNDARS